jgi:hypothetical protein
MKRLNEVAASFADYYTGKFNNNLAKEDLINAFAYGAKWGKAYLWNKVGNDMPSVKNKYRQVVVVRMITKDDFDLDVIIAEDYEDYINDEKRRGMPVLWCYLRDLLFKQVKDKAVYGYKKQEEEDEDYE